MKKYKKIYIEITNVCNLSCSFCPETKRPPEFMALSTFEDILNKISGYTKHIYFHIKGEPLLHPEVDKFLESANKRGFKVNITTNGTLISKVKNKIIDKPALRQMNFSLHSFHGNCAFGDAKEYIDSIMSFTKEAVEKTPMIISLRLWNLQEDTKVNEGKNKNEEILEIIERTFNLPYKIAEQLIPERGIMLSERVFLNQAYEFKWPDLLEEEFGESGFCYGMRDQVGILADGTVVPCCLDGEGIVNLGNILEKNFDDIVEGKRAAALYHGFSDRKVVEELCRKCGYRRRFNL